MFQYIFHTHFSISRSTHTLYNKLRKLQYDFNSPETRMNSHFNDFDEVMSYKDEMYNPLRLILIAGHKCVGKSLAAQIISERIQAEGYETRIVALADALKSIFLQLASLFNLTVECDGSIVPVSEEHLLRRDIKEKLRKYLQVIGTDIMRKQINEDIWSELLMKNIKKLFSDYVDSKRNVYMKNISYKPLFIIVDDVRYQNEIDSLKRFCNNCVSIHLIKPAGHINNDITYDNTNTHDSENQTLKTNFTYEVDKPLEIYKKDLSEFVETYLLRNKCTFSVNNIKFVKP